MCVYMEVAIWVVRIMEMAEMLWGSRWLLNIGFARRVYVCVCGTSHVYHNIHLRLLLSFPRVGVRRNGENC